MLVSAVATKVKRIFGDESGVQISDSDILAWCNDAQRDAVMQHEHLLQKLATFPVTTAVSLPTDCYTLQTVLWNNQPLNFLNSVQFYAFIGHSDVLSTPVAYTVLAKEVQLHPGSPTQGTVTLIYDKYPTELTALSDTLEIPPYYYLYIENYCLMKAYEMDEDWEAADRKGQVIQGILDYQNGRESWAGRQEYPSVTALAGDI